ncbi:hypothetical protein GCM10022251_14620 [Phytohabitans flavus]|uniref:Uncharacterized protein n=1 Tax=Phytohabitans flavus TaxID=1076124 RepID=A0A6F8Y6W9_9ACTN|nr:hypothetical protein [Phytohabitans flavus]BCB81807.1 hypothetical protein Pflav_082170 [Phytohabitans flavus]
MWRFAGRLGVVLGILVVSTGIAVAPASAAQGVTVRISEVTDRFEAGANPAELTVVATKRTRECIKVRWSLVIRVENMSLDQISIDRREEDGQFPVDFQSEGAEGRVTDERLDPGRLCRDRNVTARYRIAFDDDAGGGRVTLSVEAYDARNEFLESDTSTRNVEGDGPSPSPSPTPAQEETAAPTEEAEAPVAGDVGGPTTPASNTGGSGLLPVGLAVGGMMVFLGLTLLMRARRKVEPGQAAGRPGVRGNWQSNAARTIRERRWPNG